MRTLKLDAELVALEVAVPFLRRSLGGEAFEAEVRWYRRDLLDLAVSDKETVEVDRRIQRALQRH
jgi:hypothetical protein